MIGRLGNAVLAGMTLALAAGCGAGTLVPAQYASTANAEAGARPAAGYCPVVSSSRNFNATPIPPRSWIWFSSVISVPRAREALQLRLADSRLFFGDGHTYYMIKGTPMALSLAASSQLDLRVPRNGLWHLVAPERTTGNDLLDGVAFYVPNGLPGGVKDVTWSAKFYSKTGRTIRWQWSAAVYTSFTKTYERLGLKPLDDRHYPPFNGDRAGTPERYKQYVIGGATGSGGMDYTGSLGGRVTVKPCT
ncbi:MAG TPA: hypothetical protein VEW74_08805 [Candidatus Nitrosotalea sp.]|nr:hypothetical protein [Candidatus Nitrosotalea sp.]